MINYIKKVFEEKDKLGYQKIYISIDIHNTILKPSWNTEETYIYLGKSKEALQELSKRNDVVLIIWSASYPDRLEIYLNKFKEDNINFKYVNENPEINSGKVACFDKKYYSDILIDDKAGFSWNEWEDILNWLKEDDGDKNK